ncbi:MAG: type I methionyl aminopeptidase [Candidatus Cloacimonetes bacterium]|nr:type I methionyl aminopeptidase [Candidatus Cloacimonadota bacterium]
MIFIKNKSEIELMRESNRIVGELLALLAEHVAPGVSTWELNRIAEDYILSQGAVPSFKGYRVPGLEPFPSAICSSVNDCIVHGIPSKEVILKEGDIIGIDVGAFKNGFHGDGARSFRVGRIAGAAEKLLEVTREALNRGMQMARAGNRVGDISWTIGSFIRERGYSVADDLTGHGIGREMHEDPMIPNFGVAGKGPRLKAGMTLSIEPMVNIGTNQVIERGWEFFSADGSLSAHFENTLLVTDAEPEILTLPYN